MMAHDYVIPGGDTHFVTVPEAFSGAPQGVIHAPKFQLWTTPWVSRGGDVKQTQTIAIDRLLVDLRAVDPDAVDVDAVIRDCEHMASALRERPQRASQILSWFHEPAPDIEALASLVEDAGLAEHQALRAGGGFILLLVLVAACLVAGCGQTNKEVRKDKGPIQGAPPVR